MITEQELQAAIAECNGTRNPNASTCLKLAAFYTIQDKLFPKAEQEKPKYSYASEPPQTVEPVEKIRYTSDTDFSRLIYDADPEAIWPIMDELMSVLQATNPRLYNGVLQKIEDSY